MKNNILILGGTGFLGSNCAKELSSSNNIFILGDNSFNESKQIEFFNLKLEETEKIIKIIEANNINIIMHFVSSIVPTSSEESFIKDIHNIYIPTIKLLEYVSRHHIGFVYISSGGAVYGNQKLPFVETELPEPISYYGFSKLTFENLINFYHRTKMLRYLILRPSNPYGYGQNIFGKQGLIAVIMGKIQKNEAIEIWGNGTAEKDYIYIDDFTFYVTYLISHEECWNNTYNIGSGKSSSVLDVLTAFQMNEIILPQIKFVSENAADVKHMHMDCGKLETVVKHNCISLSDGIKLFYDALREVK